MASESVGRPSISARPLHLDGLEGRGGELEALRAPYTRLLQPGRVLGTPENGGLYLRANLPETRESDDALALVRAEVLTGLSVEFRAEKERMAGGVRVIEKAVVAGVGLVL